MTARELATRAVAALAVLSLAAAGARAAGPDPLVPAVRDAVQPQIDRHLKELLEGVV